MRKYPSLLLFCFLTTSIFGQKKPLDHSVYDGWQSIGEKMISNDGKWIVYSIDPQEGDNELLIQSSDGAYKKSISRGYNAVITEDNRYMICRVRPYFKEARDARIKKKKIEEQPKDSLVIVELGKDSTWKIGKVRNFKTPDKSAGWVAYHLEKPNEPAKPKAVTESKRNMDSLSRLIDSLQKVIEAQPRKKKTSNTDLVNGEESPPDIEDADGDEALPAVVDAGTDLVLRKLSNGEQKTFKNIVEYYFSKNGSKLLMEQAKDAKDSLSKITILLVDLRKGVTDTISKGGNEFKNFTFSEDGSQLAYIAERDAKAKELQKFYKIWYYKDGMDSASLLIDKNQVGMRIGMTVSEWGTLSFSKSGQRLFFGTAGIQAPKDTSLVESETAKLDVWNYNDDYLQTIQLFRLTQDLHENFLAVYHFATMQVVQLASKEIPVVYQAAEGDADVLAGVTDYGKRIESQWTGTTKKDIYAIKVSDGSRKLIRKDLQCVINATYISPSGKYIAWYDLKLKNYFAWGGDSVRNISARVKTALYIEDNDQPTLPGPYGIVGWQEGDSSIYVYDRYDIWKLDPRARFMPELAWQLNSGRTGKFAYRYIKTDVEERFIRASQAILLRVFNENTKQSAVYFLPTQKASLPNFQPASFTAFRKSKDANVYIYTKESYIASPDMMAYNTEDGANRETKLSAINSQQKDYNWGTAELYKWKTLSGKSSEGILYKPEDFNASKKYPVIFYFYEKLSDGLFGYIPPSPTASRLNISFFVSRGYLVFAPDITYTIGHPAKSAYDYIVGAAKDLAKKDWVDAANMAIQGQSWGGIQVAQLITMTDIFKAAWAGAPVANMTSAYGGIRWESGSNRQFQYEKTQSRIGATLWDKPELYIENSPLFQLPKVKTPLVIMSNDADGAVPWYQGIELFTGMRRLGKKVWLLNYNGEAHNLVLRRNRRDIQVREQQFFDWMLKGDKPAKWLVDGVPAVKKGKDWGLDLVD